MKHLRIDPRSNPLKHSERTSLQAADGTVRPSAYLRTREPRKSLLQAGPSPQQPSRTLPTSFPPRPAENTVTPCTVKRIPGRPRTFPVGWGFPATDVSKGSSRTPFFELVDQRAARTTIRPPPDLPSQTSPHFRRVPAAISSVHGAKEVVALTRRRRFQPANGQAAGRTVVGANGDSADSSRDRDGARRCRRSLVSGARQLLIVG